MITILPMFPRTLAFFVALPPLLTLVWAFYSLLRHRPGEPWLIWDHFFFPVILLSLGKFYYQSFLWLRIHGFFSLGPGSLLSALRKYQGRGFALWPAPWLRGFLQLWERRPPREILLLGILLPRGLVLFHLGLSLRQDSLLPFLGSLWLLLFPLLLSSYLSLLGGLLEGKMDAFLLLWTLVPGDSPQGFSLLWSPLARSLGYTEEHRDMAMEYFVLLREGTLSLENFQFWKRKILLPWNIFFSLAYLILWFLFFGRIFLA